MSDESIKPSSASNKMLNLSVDYVAPKARVKFNGNCLKEDKITLNHRKIANIYTSYERQRSFNISSYPTI